MPTIIHWGIKLCVICLSAFVIMGSFSYRLGGRVPNDFYDVGWNPDPESWQVAPPNTWINRSVNAFQHRALAKAERAVKNALQAEPMNGKALAQLMIIQNKQNNTTLAEASLKLAEIYAPARAKVRIQLADYWLEHGQLEKAFTEWGKVLTRLNNNNIQKVLYPTLYNIIHNKEGFQLFKPIINNPPAWWDSFYSYLIRENARITLVNTIYQIRNNSKVALSKAERHLLVNRYIKEDMWNDAYYIWLSGLDDKSTILNGLVYDGGFEGDQTNTSFGWNIKRNKAFQANLTNTSGVTGRRGLRIVFNGQKISFQHISQRLILPPGIYSFSFRYRLNRLNNPEGLSWKIYCKLTSNSNSQIILNSQRLSGRSPWKETQIDFSVPSSGCQNQLLRLEAASRFTHKHTFKGTIWLDDIKILRKVDSVTSLAE